ncbi:MAG: rRNA adenine N-6-methyltransferase family protein [Candidatus Anstonellales archaeon]
MSKEKKKYRKINLHLPQHLSVLKRFPQALLPKDIGIILAYTDITKNSVVLDSGFGSGFLAISLARFVKKVYSFEIREDFYKNGLKNIEKSKLDNIRLIKADIFTANLKEVLDIEDNSKIELITLDLPQPERAIENILNYKNFLAKNCYLVCILPTIEQLKNLVLFCRSKGFLELMTTESQLRDWQIKENACRPITTQVVHSTFLAIFIIHNEVEDKNLK